MTIQYGTAQKKGRSDAPAFMHRVLPPPAAMSVTVTPPAVMMAMMVMMPVAVVVAAVMGRCGCCRNRAETQTERSSSADQKPLH
jgi:hypothetical protein